MGDDDSWDWGNGMPAELTVRVQPRASRNEVIGWREGALAVRLTAPPVDGEANRACRDFLAELLEVRRAEVELLSGQTARTKRFRITSLSPEELARRLPPVAPGTGAEG